MTGNRKIFPLVFLGLCLNSLKAETPVSPPDGKVTDPKEVVQQDPFNRLSPQSSVISFLEACRAGNFERASRYLNLRQMPRDQRLSDGPRLAQQLGRILDRDAAFDVADISSDPQGDLTDGLPAD